MAWDLTLVDPDKLIGVGRWREIMAAEKKLLLFMKWLDRSYAAQTIYKYVADVKALQTTYNGLPLASMEVTFRRLPLLFKSIKKAKPPAENEKTPWEKELFDRQRKGQGEGAAMGVYTASVHRRATFTPFMKETAMCVQGLAFEQLLRLSELVRTQKATNAETFPLTWADLTFQDSTGAEIRWQQSGRVQGQPAMAVIRMVPDKMHRVGSGVLRCPFPEGWESGAAPNAAGPMLWRYANRYPVCRSMAGVTPLFRAKDPVAGQPVDRLSQTQFKAVFRELCRKASPEIQYQDFGIHCYRVGGMNRLMDMGATVPQICALGRWESDCWKVYARRHRASLWTLSEGISAQP